MRADTGSAPTENIILTILLNMRIWLAGTDLCVCPFLKSQQFIYSIQKNYFAVGEDSISAQIIFSYFQKKDIN